MATDLKTLLNNRQTAPKALPKKRTLSLSALFLAGAVSVSAVVIGILGLGSNGNQIEVDIKSVEISDAGTLSLVGARYAGRTKSGGRFDITAQEAVEGVPTAGKILLKQPDGFLLQTDGRRMNLRATEAIYEGASNHLSLEGDVQITQSANNLTLRANSLFAALDVGKITSEQPVELTGPNLIVTAEGLMANQTDNLITFTGKSRLRLQPKSDIK